MYKKYGRVLLKTLNENNPLKDKSLESVRFSNLDHIWYDSDGNIHPEFENYKGKRFSLHFKIEQHDKNGVLVPFKGNFQLIYGLGELGPRDFEGVAVAERKDQDLVRSYKLIDNDATSDYFEKNLQAVGFLAACFPNQKVEDSKAQRIFHLAAFVFDDELELENIRTGFSFHELRHFAKIAWEILYGKSVNLDNISSSAVKLPNAIVKFLGIVQLVQAELLNTEKVANVNGNYVRENFMRYIEGICLENSKEWNEPKLGTYYDAKKELRSWVGAALVCLELAMFDAKINPNPDVRETFLFQWFTTLYAKQTCLVNDLVSFRKEMETSSRGVDCNKVYLLHIKKGLPLKEAMQKVLDKANDLLFKLVDTGNLLCQLHKGDKHVERYVEKTKNIVHGHIQWYTFSDRYHKDFVFDCVLE
ncbi:unnamed protein product [Orchesella dallaii]|uniref:Terpene synthase n=1 Tax=Orchesella dallaii TaxID=48710 RepID=A0ABP1RR16_9HEXA